MYKFCLALAIQTAIVAPTAAHELWIEHADRVTPTDKRVRPTVMVGEQLQGKRYAFQPRAYEVARWIGPDEEQILHLQANPASSPALVALGTGLHILAVASFGHELEYESADDFLKFLREIEAEPNLQALAQAESQGHIHETYRRFSKSLAYLGTDTGTDRRVGLAREWVQTKDGFQLFKDDAAVADQPANITCRTANGDSHIARGRTDSRGNISFDLPPAARCVVNTVFLFREGLNTDWESDWVSTFFFTEPASED